MRVVVTGGTGFVGQWVVKELLEQGATVYLITRNLKQVGMEHPRLHLVRAALSELKTLPVQVFDEAPMDAFLHFAWEGTAGQARADIAMQLSNVQYACDAVALAKRLSCHTFMNAGSIMEYEAVQYLLKDDAKPGMGMMYQSAKLCQDFMCKTFAYQEEIRYLNIIISNIYGPGERVPRFLTSTMQRMLADEPVCMTKGEQLYDFIYVTDAARAIGTVLQSGSSMHAYYIGNTTQRPLRDFVCEMKEVLQSKSELQFGAVPFHGASLTYREFDAGALKALGFCPQVSFAEGVLKTRDWLVNKQ